MNYEQACYATRLDSVVWKHGTYEKARHHAGILSRCVNAYPHSTWKDYYEGFISDWQLFRAYEYSDIREPD